MHEQENNLQRRTFYPIDTSLDLEILPKPSNTAQCDPDPDLLAYAETGLDPRTPQANIENPAHTHKTRRYLAEEYRLPRKSWVQGHPKQKEGKILRKTVQRSSRGSSGKLPEILLKVSVHVYDLDNNREATENSTLIQNLKMSMSWSYRSHPHPSYWGPVTAQANFCEEDYILTAYIAEFINTISNLIYIYYAFHGIKGNKNRKDAILRNLPYLGIAGVGLGSFIFHATMKNYTQWCDDLSMLIATATVLHRVYTFDKSPTTTVVAGVGITAFMTIFSTWHCYMDEITMHSILFGVMIAIIGLKTRTVIATRVKDPAVCDEVMKLCTWGSVIFVTGFIIWNIDNMVCSSLTSIKRGMGMPWSFILELHGWWHIFTGVGAYIFIALVEYLTSEEAGQPIGPTFAFPVGLLIDGNLCKKVATNGHANGSAKTNGAAKANGAAKSNGVAKTNGSAKTNGAIKANGKSN